MIQHLPEMRQNIREIQNRIKEITASSEPNSQEPDGQDDDV
jgi:hypothetical protein